MSVFGSEVWRTGCARIVLCLPCLGIAAQTQQVSFERDVLPVLRQNCFACHGPSQQTSGLRLDRRSSATGDFRTIVSGSSSTSRLYLRLTSAQFGMQMPPAGPLPAAQVETIRDWIDQGAEWPDSLANESQRLPPDPAALTLIGMLRSGTNAGFLKAIARNPKLINARGPGGATVFMFAVLYGDSPMLARLLKLGAQVNARNDANASALLWAAGDLTKTQILVRHGGDVNVRSDYLRTPLMVAARIPSGAATVRFLLDAGANPNPNAHPATESSPLIEAATAAEPDVMQLLISRGADIKAAGQPALAMAIYNRCPECRDLLLKGGVDAEASTGALSEVAHVADTESVRGLLDHGANVNYVDSFGRTPLMYAAGSDLLPLNVVRMLIEKGANVNAVDGHQQAPDSQLTVLDVAQLRGNTPIVELLVKLGAKGSASAPLQSVQSRHGNTIRDALARSIPRLQAADAGFTQKAGCVSCHNLLADMAVTAARSAGFQVDEQIAAQQMKTNAARLAKDGERMYQSFLFSVEDNFGPDALGYTLIALAGQQYKPDLNTDAAAMYIRARQGRDGHWEIGLSDQRPPLGAEFVGQTALAMRSLQLYAPRNGAAAYATSIQRAAHWLAEAPTTCNDDRAWKVLGLAWDGKNRSAMERAAQELLRTQRSDGGWSDVPSMTSNAYATGKTLVALQTAGVTGGAIERGVRFLLDSQGEDGTWHVKSRAFAFQPYFESGFPHRYDQWISTAGTSWATMALALSAKASVQPAQSAALSRGLR